MLDGRDDDWPDHEGIALGIDNLLEIQAPYTDRSLTGVLRVGSDADHLYLHYAINDDIVVYRGISMLSVHRNDHLQLATIDSSGTFTRYTLAVQQPGEVTVMEVSPGGRALRPVDGISGRWMATEAGYNVELRIPRELVGRRFSTLVADVDDEQARDIRFMMGLTHTRSPAELGTIVYSPTELEQLLQSLPYPLRLAHVSGVVLTTRDFVALEAGGYLESSVPLQDHGKHLGDITLRQTDRPARYLFESMRLHLALLFAMTLLLVGMATLFAAWLFHRKLQASKRVILSRVDAGGQVRAVEGEGVLEGGDAIAELARDASSAMTRVGQYNDYLERMASRLNHELRDARVCRQVVAREPSGPDGGRRRRRLRRAGR